MRQGVNKQINKQIKIQTNKKKKEINATAIATAYVFSLRANCMFWP